MSQDVHQAYLRSSARLCDFENARKVGQDGEDEHDRVCTYHKGAYEDHGNLGNQPRPHWSRLTQPSMIVVAIKRVGFLFRVLASSRARQTNHMSLNCLEKVSRKPVPASETQTPIV